MFDGAIQIFDGTDQKPQAHKLWANQSLQRTRTTPLRYVVRAAELGVIRQYNIIAHWQMNQLQA